MAGATTVDLVVGCDTGIIWLLRGYKGLGIERDEKGLGIKRDYKGLKGIGGSKG